MRLNTSKSIDTSSVGADSFALYFEVPFKGILYIKELMEGEGIGKEEKDEITRQFVECGKKLEEFT